MGADAIDVFFSKKRYCTGDSGCYDAENGWMAGMP